MEAIKFTCINSYNKMKKKWNIIYHIQIEWNSDW
jgi:hypothetical protein